MASPLSDDEVRRIAALARLDLTDDEVRRFASQLTAIVGYASTIEEADTTAVRPDTSVVTAMRDDVTTPGLDRDQALSGAPESSREAGLFRVPKVL